MPQTFRDFASVKKHLLAAINNSLEKEVAQKVKQVEQENIQSTVYDACKPSVYKRRWGNGGLLDERNMRSGLVADGVIEITNETPPNPLYEHDALRENYIGYAVESGKDYDYFSPGARPFTADTVEDLKTNKQHIAALMDGLIRQGFEVRLG